MLQHIYIYIAILWLEKLESMSFSVQAVIRVLFPDNYILEAKFQASDSLSELIDLLRKVISRPDIPFYLCKDVSELLLFHNS